MTDRLFGTCQHCARLKWLTPNGRIATHVLPARDGRIRRKCPGSGRPPRPDRGPR